jgi:hypothetical protein
MSEVTASLVPVYTPAELRAKALQASPGVPKVLDLDGMKFAIVAPTIGQDSDVRSKATKVVASKSGSAEVKVDQGLQKAWACIHLVRSLDGRPVFTPVDLAAILEAPRGSLLDKLATEASKALEVDEEEAGKN